MLDRLALAAVCLTTAAALYTTILTWRARIATPRTISLVLAATACVAMLVAAADLPVALPASLCRLPVRRDADDSARLGERLRAALGRWTWAVWPCGRLDVEVDAADLQDPLPLGELVEMAASAGVVVDVTLKEGVPSPAREVVLAVTRGNTMPSHAPIPASFTEEVTPKLASAEDTWCRLDDGATHSGATLATLLESAISGVYASDSNAPRFVGFHRLRCWRASEDPPSAASTSYVRITDGGVTIASGEERFVGEFRKKPHDVIKDTGDFKTFGLDTLAIVGEVDSPGTTSMLVLDRPREPKSCALAKNLLERGATVIVAMPEDGFFSRECKAWFPITGQRPSGEALFFDRSPRLTFYFDDSMKGLDSAPTFVFGCPAPSAQGGTRLPSSRVLQENLARELCEEARDTLGANVDCDGPYKSRFPTDPRGDIGELRYDSPTPVKHCLPSNQRECDEDRIDRSSPVNALSSLARQFSNERDFWENELFVVFTHDQRPFSWDSLQTSFPSRIHIVEMMDPYGVSLSNIFSAGVRREMNIPALAGLVDNPKGRLPPPRPLEETTTYCDRLPRTSWREAPDAPPLTSKGPWFNQEGQTKAEFLLPSDAISRFPRQESETQHSTEAPIRFGWWKKPDENSSHVPAPRMLAQTTTDGGLVERSLAFGTMVGPGHLLFLSYSPFEDAAQTEPPEWRKQTRTSVDVLGGMKLITDLYRATEEQLAAVHGSVVAVAPKADGAVWVTVVRDTGEAAFDTLSFDPPESAPELGALVAPLIDFDLDRRLYTYALPSAELERLPRCAPFIPALKDGGDQPPIHVCPPDDAPTPTFRMDAAQALTQLVRTTGGCLTDTAKASGVGCDGERARRDVLRTRTLGLGLLAFSFLLAWGRRASRRLSGLAADRRLRNSIRIAQRRYDPPDAVVAAAGDWDGRATTWPRTGAFGGYRPLEPGDRASAVVLTDLLVRQMRGTPMLPRVALRIEEAAPSVLVLVNLGASMRGPVRADITKAVFAGRVGLHIAASAWKIGGEVSVHATGIDGEAEILGPLRLGPGHEEVEQSLRERLRQRPAREVVPLPGALPECGAVVYVSDFQLEDARTLQAWVTELESAGIRVGGVMVYSPHEFTMIEGGRLAGSEAWVDRADWDPDDVFEAFGRRRDEIERIFDVSTTGGLIVASTTFRQDEIELVLEGGRLLHILR